MSKSEFKNFKERLKKSPKERLIELSNKGVEITCDLITFKTAIEKENLKKINEKIADILIDEYHINELVYMIPVDSISGCLSYPKYYYESKSVDAKEKEQSAEDNQDKAFFFTVDLPDYGVTLDTYTYPYVVLQKVIPNIGKIPNSPIREEDRDRIAYTAANFISNEIVDFLIDIGHKEEIDYEAAMLYTNESCDCDNLLKCFKKLRTNIYRRTFHKHYPSYLIVAPDVYTLLLINKINGRPECEKIEDISETIENEYRKDNNIRYCGTLTGMKVFVSTSLSKGEYLEGVCCHSEGFPTSSIMWTPYMLLGKKEDTGEYVSMYGINAINPQLIVRSRIIYDYIY